MLNLVFLLDITGSMGRELAGVKTTVARLVTKAWATSTDELFVTVITFTEDASGCFVTRHAFSDGEQAVKFVNRIRLCQPPGMPNVLANGGDGPENHKAALAELLWLDGTTPTIAFLITDAVPHLIDRPSVEASLECEHLKQQHGIEDPDLFALLDRVANHFDGNLVLSVFKCTQTKQHALYGAVAKRLNGVLTTPLARDAGQLADGLMAILLRLLASLQGDTKASHDPKAVKAFQFYDLGAVITPMTERGREGIAVPIVGSTEELLYRFIERTTVIAGSRFKKRAISMHLVNEQLQLMMVLAKGLVRELSKEEALTRASVLLDKIRSQMEASHVKQFKLTVQDLDAVLSNEIFATSVPRDEFEAAVSALTLMTVEESARDAVLNDSTTESRDPRDLYASLLAVAGLFLGHLSVLRLPERLGVVDFTDAWSAEVDEVSNDLVSAADFLELIGDRTAVAGLRSREHEYNFLQLVADPVDALGSELMHLATGTQVLDILTALLSGATPGLFSPNMFRGTLSACLMKLLSTRELTEFQWELVAKMVHTVRLLMGEIPMTLTLEPESAMGKLLFRLLRLETTSHSAVNMRSFLEEMAAARVQRFAKRNNTAYHTLVETVVGYDHGSAADTDAWHVLVDGDSLGFDGSRAVRVLKASKFCRNFELCAGNVLRAANWEGSASSLQQVWPDYAEEMTKLLLLQKRTERYTLVKTTDTGNDQIWVKNNAVMTASLESEAFDTRALALLRQKYDSFVRATRKLRQDKAATERWLSMVAFMRSPLLEFFNSLQTVVRSSQSPEHKILLRAFAVYGHKLPTAEYEAKVTAVVTGRVIEGESDRVVFNRGNLHAHPDRFLPISGGFKEKLHWMQRTRKWSRRHAYRESGIPNHSGHSNANPSEWAANRSEKERTFWDDDECEGLCCRDFVSRF